ncbi:MAG TPA: aminotransferase class V-fold PLP-dependent enzyme [Candidatus Acidoferrales bacterium]|nr:aminotransferase class V-fold PLP-dependent enzyme [Candidatus Acidoferrales bacterium]
MNTTRRQFLSGIGGLAALGAVPGLGPGSFPPPAKAAAPPSPFPAKSDFAIPEGVTYINSAYTHPMPVAAMKALRRYAEVQSEPEGTAKEQERADIKTEFAALINAKPSEICFVPNTSTGENLVVNGLGIPHTGGNVVTDALHFEGALLHLGELEKRNGLDLRIVKPRDWRIDLKDMEKVVDKNTKLVEISLVTMDNGFQHDLKAVCDLAHAHRAYVYADIVQAAGNSPIDVRQTGLDFAACSTFKWLMGDFGLGFLYVKEALLDRLDACPQFGYFQARSLDSHILPGEPPAASPYTWELRTDATGHFEVGTPAIGVTHILAQSLPYIRRLGVENIQAYRQPLLKRLREEMPRLGYRPITPPESTSALISFAIEDYRPVLERLRRGNVNVRLGRHFLRVSPSVFNDMKDIDKLLETLA